MLSPRHEQILGISFFNGNVGEAVEAGEKRIGKLERLAVPSLEAEAEQLPPIGEWTEKNGEVERAPKKAPGSPPFAVKTETVRKPQPSNEKATDGYGIVVFSHLRWDFFYQRPQHVLSRLAKRWRVVFIEKPVCAAGRNELDVFEPAPGVPGGKFSGRSSLGFSAMYGMISLRSQA